MTLAHSASVTILALWTLGCSSMAGPLDAGGRDAANRDSSTASDAPTERDAARLPDGTVDAPVGDASGADSGPGSDGAVSSGPYANRPPSYTTVIADYPFDAATYPAGTAPYYDVPDFDGSGWGIVGGVGLSRVLDPMAPVSPPNTMQWTYPPGAGGTGVGRFYRTLDTSISEIYVAFSIWHDPSFEWNTISNKLFYWEDGNIILQSRHNDNYLSLYIGAYDAVYDANGYVPQESDFDGRWVNIEYIIERGDPGRLRVWMNGNLVSDHVVQVPEISGTSEINLNSTWGGGGTRTRTSYRRVDHLLVATP